MVCCMFFLFAFFLLLLDSHERPADSAHQPNTFPLRPWGSACNCGKVILHHSEGWGVGVISICIPPIHTIPVGTDDVTPNAAIGMNCVQVPRNMSGIPGPWHQPINGWVALDVEPRLDWTASSQD